MLNHIFKEVSKQEMDHVYQPMWNLGNWKVFGFEALLRFPDGSYEGSIEDVFRRARENGFLFELDTLSISKAINSFPIHLLEDEFLFVNLYPSTLLHEKFEDFLCTLLDRYPKVKRKIVFELNETQDEDYVWDIPELKEKVSMLREYGFLVALDDIGKGAATLQKIIEFSPNFIKLDRYFANELYLSKEKQDMISLLVQYSDDKMGLILEGIEKDVDLAQAKLLNVPFAQGYLLGTPDRVYFNKYTGAFKNSYMDNIFEQSSPVHSWGR